jgi:DNA-binding NarL/FixJ family response regulator
MAHTHILIYGLQRMMHQIIENAMVGQPDLEVVSSDRGSLADAVEQCRADAVITGGDDPQMACALLERHPRVKVLAVVADGRETLLYEFRPRRARLGELSPAALLEAVRRACRQQSEADPSL